MHAIVSAQVAFCFVAASALRSLERSAILARQALEGALDELWRRCAPGLELCSARAQFICLPSRLPHNRDLGERLSYAWFGLSRACHHRLYELPPTSAELLTWIGTIEAFIVSVEAISTALPRQGELERHQ